MLLDEAGKIKGFPLNRKATVLYKFGETDPIVEDALVCEAHLID